MLRFTKNLKSTRLGVKRRAETDESSLARTKFANGPLFVWSSPNQQNKHWLVDENEKKYDGLESRYIEGKVGHQEVPIKDWLMPKPTRWQVEWSKYWMVGKFVNFMFQGFIFSIQNFEIFEISIFCPKMYQTDKVSAIKGSKSGFSHHPFP